MFLIDAFLSASGYNFHLSQFFRSFSDFYTQGKSDEQSFLRMPEKVSAVYRNFQKS